MPAGANSLNTNAAALLALSNLNSINNLLDRTQDRVSTGLKVVGAVDNASSFAIAQGIRSDIKAFASVSQGLANGKGLIGVTLAAMNALSDLLGNVQAKVTEALNPGNTTQQQAIIQADYSAFQTQGQLVFINGANFNGRNLLSTGSVNAAVISNIDGTSIAIRAASNVLLAWANMAIETVASTSAALAALSSVNSAKTTMGFMLGQLGADFRQIEFQDQFIGKISDAQQVGLGSIVDADLARESAKLQAFQVQQQLSIQTLNIANSSPNALLSLFR